MSDTRAIWSHASIQRVGAGHELAVPIDPPQMSALFAEQLQRQVAVELIDSFHKGPPPLEVGVSADDGFLYVRHDLLANLTATKIRGAIDRAVAEAARVQRRADEFDATTRAELELELRNGEAAPS